MNGGGNRIADLSNRLQGALDTNYNVVDMATVLDVVRQLETAFITKEQLETTRLAMHINQLRRNINDTMARRLKNLIKKWRQMVIPPAQQPVAAIAVAAASVHSPSPGVTAVQPHAPEHQQPRVSSTGRRPTGNAPRSTAAGPAGSPALASTAGKHAHRPPNGQAGRRPAVGPTSFNNLISLAAAQQQQLMASTGGAQQPAGHFDTAGQPPMSALPKIPKKPKPNGGLQLFGRPVEPDNARKRPAEPVTANGHASAVRSPPGNATLPPPPPPKHKKHKKDKKSGRHERHHAEPSNGPDATNGSKRRRRSSASQNSCPASGDPDANGSQPLAAPQPCLSLPLFDADTQSAPCGQQPHTSRSNPPDSRSSGGDSAAALLLFGSSSSPPSQPAAGGGAPLRKHQSSELTFAGKFARCANAVMVSPPVSSTASPARAAAVRRAAAAMSRPAVRPDDDQIISIDSSSGERDAALDELSQTTVAAGDELAAALAAAADDDSRLSAGQATKHRDTEAASLTAKLTSDSSSSVNSNPTDSDEDSDDDDDPDLDDDEDEAQRIAAVISLTANSARLLAAAHRTPVDGQRRRRRPEHRPTPPDDTETRSSFADDDDDSHDKRPAPDDSDGERQQRKRRRRDERRRRRQAADERRRADGPPSSGASTLQLDDCDAGASMGALLRESADELNALDGLGLADDDDDTDGFDADDDAPDGAGPAAAAAEPMRGPNADASDASDASDGSEASDSDDSDTDGSSSDEERGTAVRPDDDSSSSSASSAANTLDGFVAAPAVTVCDEVIVLDDDADDGDRTTAAKSGPQLFGLRTQIDSMRGAPKRVKTTHELLQELEQRKGTPTVEQKPSLARTDGDAPVALLPSGTRPASPNAVAPSSDLSARLQIRPNGGRLLAHGPDAPLLLRDHLRSERTANASVEAHIAALRAQLPAIDRSVLAEPDERPDAVRCTCQVLAIDPDACDESAEREAHARRVAAEAAERAAAAARAAAEARVRRQAAEAEAARQAARAVQPKRPPVRSIFDLDYSDDEDALLASVTVARPVPVPVISVQLPNDAPERDESPAPAIAEPAVPDAPAPVAEPQRLCEVHEDPECPARRLHVDRKRRVTRFHVHRLHNVFVAGVNGNWDDRPDADAGKDPAQADGSAIEHAGSDTKCPDEPNANDPKPPALFERVVPTYNHLCPERIPKNLASMRFRRRRPASAGDPLRRRRRRHFNGPSTVAPRLPENGRRCDFNSRDANRQWRITRDDRREMRQHLINALNVGPPDVPAVPVLVAAGGGGGGNGGGDDGNGHNNGPPDEDEEDEEDEEEEPAENEPDAESDSTSGSSTSADTSDTETGSTSSGSSQSDGQNDAGAYERRRRRRSQRTFERAVRRARGMHDEQRYARDNNHELPSFDEAVPDAQPEQPPEQNYREWHEVLMRRSYNGELLTILPYVVID